MHIGPQLEGNALLYSVSLLACLGFLLIGYDNGLMGGLVGAQSFYNTFKVDQDTDAGTDMIALIVAIVSSVTSPPRCLSSQTDHSLRRSTKSDASSAPS